MASSKATAATAGTVPTVMVVTADRAAGSLVTVVTVVTVVMGVTAVLDSQVVTADQLACCSATAATAAPVEAPVGKAALPVD
ncbi:MAG: hypothetical protein ACSLE8_23850 [Rhodococcus sp. (in: high G+C Gram-positive bacteria)]